MQGIYIHLREKTVFLEYIFLQLFCVPLFFPLSKIFFI